MKIRTKMIVVFISIMLLNSIICGILFYNYAAKDTLENYEDSAKDITRQINLYLDNQVHSALERIYAMCNNSGFNQSMSKYVNTPSSFAYPAMLGLMSNALTEVRNGERYIDSLYVYTKFGSFDTFTKTRNHNFFFESSYLYQPFQQNENQNIAWFPAGKSEIFSDSDMVIPMVYKYHISGSHEDMYVVINFSAGYFERHLSANYESFDYLYLVDQYGEAITDIPQNLEEQTRQVVLTLAEGKETIVQQKISYHGQMYLATVSKMPTSRWMVCALKSEQSLLKNMSASQQFIISLLVITGFTSMVLIIMMSYSITNPLSKMVEAMDLVKKGDFQVRYPYKGRNEVGKLANTFNLMVMEINRLVERLNIQIEALEKEQEKVKKIQELKRVAELKALQAQINPHFLYNTLNTITWEASNAGVTQVSKISNALGKFFRISLSEGREIISFKEELEHATSYLEIQKIRYQDKLNYEISVNQDLYTVRVIKLILQPLIENAIYHGIKEKTEGGMIKIMAQCKTDMFGTDVLIVTVEDDGIGVLKNKLEEINNNLMDGNMHSGLGYGIYNVNERIRLYFGEEYGLSLSSEEGHWTKSVFIIPVSNGNETYGG